MIDFGPAWLTYLNARYYDSVLGRFLSPDPLMDPGDPRTLDPYRYADNNPISFTDATGLRPDCSGLQGDSLSLCRSAPSYSAGQAQKRRDVRTYHDEQTRRQSAELNKLYDPWYAPGVLGMQDWGRGFVDSVIGMADLVAATGCAASKGGLYNWGSAQGCFDVNDSGGFFLGRLGPSEGQDTQASYWIGSLVNPTLLIGVGGVGTTAARATATATTNTGFRLAQDIAVNPVAPRALGLGRSIGRASHNQALKADVAALPQGATGIRVNQQQVNALEQRVGINRPDLQYTLDGQRYYVEYEGLANTRGALHEARILDNDPDANFILRIVP